MRARLATMLAAAALLAGCATTPSAPTSAGETLSGRLSVHVDAAPGTEARNVNATFDLQGTPQQGRLDMSTPLGTVLAQARWAPGKVALVTFQGETLFESLDALTREVLGESLPVAALFDWLRGRPWAGAPSMANAAASEPGFVQLGWVVDLARFSDGLIAARRQQAPSVIVRAKLDRP